MYIKAIFIDEPVKEENDWWFHVQSVICYSKVSIIKDEDERTARLRQFGQKYFPDGYDLDSDLMKNSPHVAVLDFNIEHIRKTCLLHSWQKR